MDVNFKQRRKSLGYSIEKLAEISGVCASTIKNIEGEKRIPRKVTFELIVKYLRLSINYEDYYKFLHERKRNLEKENSAFDEMVKNKMPKVKDLYMKGEYEGVLEILKEVIDSEEI